MSKTQTPPVAIFELIPMSTVGAGFVREDTVNSPNPIRILHPQKRVIMNTSVVRQELKDEPGTFVNVPIRYIYGQAVIDQKLQDKENMRTSVRDKIVMINGFLTVTEDGPFVGLYRFMMANAQNNTNPNRVDNGGSIVPVFRQIKAEEDAGVQNHSEFKQLEAMAHIRKFVTEKDGGYIYDEDGIDLLCSTFNVFADGPGQKVNALIAFAKHDPVTFLAEVQSGQQQVLIEIKHALQLKMISIEGTIVAYVEGDVLIKKLSNALNTDDKKISGLAAYFSKAENQSAYELFKAKLAEAKVAELA